MNFKDKSLHSWYTTILREQEDTAYCDHLAVNLLIELCEIAFRTSSKQSKTQPHNSSIILTRLTTLAQVLNVSSSAIQRSLELLDQLQLISVSYPFQPEKLLAGEIQIKIQYEQIAKLSEASTLSSRRGYIYVVRSGVSNLYKIGRTTNLKKRLQTLQTSCAVSLNVVKTLFCSDAIALEKAAHTKFAHYRKTGEWFALNNEQLNQLLTWLDNWR